MSEPKTKTIAAIRGQKKFLICEDLRLSGFALGFLWPVAYGLWPASLFPVPCNLFPGLSSVPKSNCSSALLHLDVVASTNSGSGDCCKIRISYSLSPEPLVPPRKAHYIRYKYPPGCAPVQERHAREFANSPSRKGLRYRLGQPGAVSAYANSGSRSNSPPSPGRSGSHKTALYSRRGRDFSKCLDCGD